MDPIDLLEKRIAALELQILPQQKNIQLDKSQMVTDLLLQTHSMTATALTCREVVTSILRRMEAINDLLNPNYGDSELDIQEKKQYVVELYPEMKRTMALVVEFERLKLYLDSSSIHNIPLLVGQLEKLTISSVNTYDECREVTDKILDSLQQYNDITRSIKTLFGQLEMSITNIEISLQPKLLADE